MVAPNLLIEHSEVDGGARRRGSCRLDRARGRVIELRRQGLSADETSAQLAREGTPLNRTSVGEILTEEGFRRLLRHPGQVASTAVAIPGRDTRLPRTAALDFATWPRKLAELLRMLPGLQTRATT